MASIARLFAPFVPSPQKAVAQVVAESRVEAVATAHAVVALAAKLASVDGAPNTAEYAAFEALFAKGEGADARQRRSLFLMRVTDSSPALQYARHIAASVPELATRRALLGALVQMATADGALNAAEMELLRAVADIFGVTRSEFRAEIARTLVPAGASPYAVLGVAAEVSDEALRAHYMARVQMLHPDRYHAAGASAETIAMLSDQLAAVNAAYRAVQVLRSKQADRASGWWPRRNTKGASLAA